MLDLAKHFEEQGHTSEHPPTLHLNGVVLTAYLLGSIGNAIEKYGAITIQGGCVDPDRRGLVPNWAQLLTNAPEQPTEEDNVHRLLQHVTTLLYKARGGECKELKVVQPLDPDQRTLDFKDLQILAREIAKVLQEDAA